MAKKTVTSKKKGPLVVQSNRLIEAHYRLSLQEQRIIKWMVAQIHQDDEDFKDYTLTVKEFSELANIEKDGAYIELQNVIKSLQSHVLFIKPPHDKLFSCNWFYYCEYGSQYGSITLKFAPELKPYLLQLKNDFTSIPLSFFFSMKCKYTPRLYEACFRFIDTGVRLISYLDLRNLLGLKKEEYPNFNNFKQRVLTPAVKEINIKSDITLDCTEQREGKKVEKLQFDIAKKKVKK